MCKCTPTMRTPFCGRPGCEGSGSTFRTVFTSSEAEHVFRNNPGLNIILCLKRSGSWNFCASAADAIAFYHPQVSALDKWDFRFLDLANTIARWSKYPSTQTGAIIVRPDKTIASIGYNGFARGCDDHPTFYEDREEKLGRIIHAEMNAILSAREPLHGYTLYNSTFLTCDRCAVHAIQAGIRRVVAPICPPDKAARWETLLHRARDCFKEAGVVCEEVAYANS